MKPEFRALIKQYLTVYYPEHCWTCANFTVTLTGDIVTIDDEFGVKPMFGQKALLNFCLAQ